MKRNARRKSRDKVEARSVEKARAKGTEEKEGTRELKFRRKGAAEMVNGDDEGEAADEEKEAEMGGQ